MVHPHQAAWAAGVLEGEACFDIRPSPCTKRDPGNKTCRIVVEMKDRDVLEQLQALFGGSLRDVTCPSKLRSNWAPYFKWQLTAREAVFDCLLHVAPYLGKRRIERVREMLTFLEPKVCK